MSSKDFSNVAADGVHRIEVSERILKDHRDLPAADTAASNVR
jgi:hypothetical protein